MALKVFKVLLIFFPWKIRRLILVSFFHYKIHPTARIGYSYIYPEFLIMKKNAVIGNFNVAIHIENMELGSNSIINRSNWITGYLEKEMGKIHYGHQTNRRAELILGDESSITKNHHIDCTNRIHIGRFVTVAGYNSQLLTHSIDVYENRQDSNTIIIGDYCFIGTRSILLGGSRLPDYSILAAGAVLNKSYSDVWSLYGGIPARKIKQLPHTAKYFSRESGFVY